MSSIKKNIVICKQANQQEDIEYWVKQSYAKRIEALETIRREYNTWKYGAQSRFQRVYRVIKQT